ncbi:hypothetical protein [Flavobacterium sp.]|uniref:hypothetical protein n=1 Tax=Flavobacterium sp. TaxID=239 RepID=UPI000ECFD430|nr:hypothetical protein [Flavobacterium sp.]HCQ12388.1 hypothetical protein [Flavobacterium sp.]
MGYRINIAKSVKKERLIFSPNLHYIFDIIMEALLYAIWPIMTYLIIINPINKVSLTGMVIMIFLNVLLAISWFYIYKLHKIKITNPERDRKILVQILKKRFPEMQINDDGLYILRSKKNTGSFSWGKSLTVIFNENYIYINLTTLGRHDVKSPIHSIANYLKLKSIEKEFKRN